MKRLATLFLIILMAGPALADLVISNPKIGVRFVPKVELGSSPRFVVKFKNNYGKDILLTRAEIYINYDYKVIDHIVSIKSGSDKLVETESDYLSTTGLIKYKLSTPSPLRVANGAAVDLMIITVHLSQSYPNQGSAALFKWAGPPNSAVWWENSNVTGTVITPPAVELVFAAPPVFAGINFASSQNSYGQQNVGNTVFLNWRTSGPGTLGLTPFEKDKFNYRIYRDTSNNMLNAVLLSPPESPRSEYDDPASAAPYLGNVEGTEYYFQDGPGTGVYGMDPLIDGKVYYYRIDAGSNLSPWTKWNTGSRVLDVIPFDFTPPKEVTQLTALPDDRKIFLRWTNPPDPDFGGIVIVRNVDAPLNNVINLGSATNNGSGPQLSVWQSVGGGQVIYAPPQEDYEPTMVPQEFEDWELDNDKTYYYRVFTYDRATAYEFGRNYSKGVAISRRPGLRPEPITNFEVLPGAYQGEINLRYKNSTSPYAEGVIIRYSNVGYGELLDEKSGMFAMIQPVTSGPGMEENITAAVGQGKRYYFRAFAYNQTSAPLDPESESSRASHLFSTPAQSMIVIPSGEEPTEDFVLVFNKLAGGTGLNSFALPFPLTSVRDESGNPIDIATVEKLILALDKGKHYIKSLGWWDENLQKPAGIVMIDWSKPVPDCFTFTPGVTVNTPVHQGQALQVNISDSANPDAALTHTIIFKIVR